ncbi:hypothetical protein CEQ90_09715 [Lewinellaceae bacterium SD302]|nr:hypothetical protein CEQ90_09715 [Lewinellaceae bacterium SD302]
MHTHKIIVGFSLLLIIATGTLSAQRLSTDVDRMLYAANMISDSSYDAAALDTLILELAYYATAPDTNAAHKLASGPAILAHYGKNEEIAEFIKRKGLDSLLWEHQFTGEPAFGWLVVTDRINYLRKPKAADLFSRNGLIDVEKIQSAYTTPLPPMRQAIPLAVDRAKEKAAPIPDPTYVSLALTGLSDWIGRRAQEELTFTFLTRLRKQLNENKLEYLFPNTVEYLPTLNLINYKSILPSIRQAFAKDMNQISLNLGNFLNARDPNTYSDPAVYNMFMVYRLLDLGVRKVPLSDILAFTYGELADTRLNTRRNIDLTLAEMATGSEEYSTVMSAYNRLIIQLDLVENAFQRAKSDLSDIEEEIVDDHGEDPVRPFRNQIDQAIDFDFSNLLFQREEAPEVIRSWLLGEPAYAYFSANPSLTKYDEFFGPDRQELTPQQLRAAGLTGVRELLSRRDQLNQRYDYLISARATLDSLRSALNVPVVDSSSFAIKRQLTSRLDKEFSHFRRTKDSTQLRFLTNLLAEVLPETPGSLEKLRAISSRLDTFSIRSGDLSSPNYQRLNPAEPTPEVYANIKQEIDLANQQFNLMFNALNVYSQDNASNLIRAHRNAANFETVFGLGKELFFLLYDREGDSDDSATFTGLARNNEFAAVGTITNLLLDPDADLLIRGLARERLGRVPGIGQLNGKGIGQFVMSFTEQLAQLRAPLPPGTPDKRTAARIKTVAFITGTVSKIVEAQFLNDPLQPGTSYGLVDILPGFSKVPEINGNLEELFRLSQSGQFRYAITNLIQLIDLFGIIPPASKKQQRLVKQRDYYRNRLTDQQEGIVSKDYLGLALHSAPVDGIDSTGYFQSQITVLDRKLRNLDTARVNRQRQELFLYGTFMADVAAADNPDAFAAALNNVALPPGSSQLKRNRPFSLELNAYFGFTYGREVLNYPDDVLALDDLPKREASVVSLFVPVGLSMSWKTSYQQKSSYSLFLPLIDLGAVSAYRFDTAEDQVERLPRFTFQNVFAPGAHLMYNFANTPFSLGFGAQYGPTTRRINPDGSPQFNASGVRFMASFSVDVPVFSFTSR